MTDLTANVISSLIGGIVWAVVYRAWVSYQERNGMFSGSWFEFVYDWRDTEMVGSPLAINWMECRQVGSSFKAKAWRLYTKSDNPRTSLPITWRFIGRYQEGVLDAVYWPIQGDGGRGTIHLWKLHVSRCQGNFTTWVTQEEDSRPITPHFRQAGIVWFRQGTESEIRQAPHLALAVGSPLLQTLPRRIRKRAVRRLNAMSVENDFVLERPE